MTKKGMVYMTLLSQIQTDLTTALKAKNTFAVDALRYIVSQIKYARIAKMADLTDEEVIRVIQKEVKSREEAIALFIRGKRQDLVDLENQKLAYITKYLPARLNDEELTTLIQKILKENPDQKNNFGFMMKQVMTAAAGKTDGATVARLLKTQLS